MPLLKARMGSSCKAFHIKPTKDYRRRSGLATYVAMCHFFCDSVEAYQQGFSPHAQEIMGDILNYTDVSPVVQISEVVVERS